jgi:hypothetical protein
MYRSMNNSGTITSTTALDIIDMTSMFTVLIPQLIKDLGVSSIMELDVIDSQELLNVYRTQVVAWVINWQKLLAEYLVKNEPNQDGDES